MKPEEMDSGRTYFETVDSETGEKIRVYSDPEPDRFTAVLSILAAGLALASLWLTAAAIQLIQSVLQGI